MNRKKDLELIQREKESIIEQMAMYASDSVEYKDLQERLKTYVEMEETILTGQNERGLFGKGLKVATLLVSVAGVILVPNMLADKAYDNEKNFSLKNGTVWNLIGRTFGPFKF